ncbi:MAG: PhnD/SsuA/transferrin family substrate-binding protein [Deltaproteobacteria bacterium]|nr:PhnD/SsuA/transferrin family substrate-binding protein [Deltaproteobacteria bacterium]
MISIDWKGTVPALFVAVLLLFPGCDSTSRKQVEVLSAPSPGKKTVRAAASDELHIHFQKVAEAYSTRHDIQFQISQTQGINIPELVEKKIVDIGVTSRGFSPEKKGSNLSYVPYAFDGVAFYASNDAKVRALSLDQVRKILSGRITNWKEVGGADREIRVLDRPVYSSTRIAIASSLFAGNFPTTKAALTLETSENAYHALKSLSSYLAYGPISRLMVEQFPAVPLVIDGMPAAITNVPSRKYPARLEYGLLFPKDAPRHVIDFANYLASVDGMHRLASLGLIPAAGNLSLSSCHCRATEGLFAPTRKSPLAGNLTIAVVPELGAIEQEKRYSGICQTIAEEMGVRTQLKHMESYGSVLREFEEGRIDAAFVGSLIYGRLHERLGVVPLARPESENVSFYKGLLVVRNGSGVRHFSDLRGKSFAYVPNTSAGELFTRLLLAKGPKVGERQFFSRVVRVSTHTDAINLVAEGKVDGAAVKDLVLKRMTLQREKGGSYSLKDRIRILESSVRFPENALVVSPLLDPKQRSRLRDILLGCDRTEAGRAALELLGADRFVPTSDEDYARMYDMAQEAGYSFGKK